MPESPLPFVSATHDLATPCLPTWRSEDSARDHRAIDMSKTAPLTPNRLSAKASNGGGSQRGTLSTRAFDLDSARSWAPSEIR